MDNDGEISWLLKLGGKSLDPTSSKSLSDSCQGIVYEPKRDVIVSVIETNSP